jgi:YD repeat-containing protein
MFLQTAVATPGVFASLTAESRGRATLPEPPVRKGGLNTLLPLPGILSIPFLPLTAGFVLAGVLNPPPLTARPGTAYPWEPSFPVYSGSANLATGNLTLTHHVAGWSGIGPSLSFDLVYNSQSTATGTLGVKWSHSFDWKVTPGSNPVVRYSNGRTVTFTAIGGLYTPPSYIREKLTAAGGGYKLEFKDGTEYSFDSAGKLTSIADENSNTVSLAYTSGNLTAITDPVGRVMTLAYTSGKISSVTDSESKAWTLTYDASGRLDKVNMPSLGGSTYFTKFTYNANNCVSGITDRLNKTWTYAYSANNSFATCTNPLNGIRGFVSTQSRDWDPGFIADQTELEEWPDDDDASYPGDTTEIVLLMNEAGNCVEFGMDINGRTTASRDSYGYQTNYTYTTSYDRSAVIEKGGHATQFTYDSNGNVLTVKDPLNNTQTYTYDSHNHMLTSKDPLNHTTTNTYDSNGNMLTTTDPTGVTTTYSYNLNGTVDTIEDEVGNETDFGYDSNGNTTSITDPLNHTTTYVYTCCRVTSRTDARNRTTTYTYDAWGRRTGINYPTSTDQSFTFDVEGRMTQAVDGTGTRSYTYDALGRKTYQTDPRGNTTATYDPASRLLSQTDVTGRLIEYDYDVNGRMELVEDPTSWASYEFDPRGRMTKESFSNGVYSAYAYDNASRLTSLNHKKTADNTVILGYTATYDAASRLTQAVESPTTATTSYVYDNANRLTSEDRTGANPYLSDYTYNSRGLRATAFRSENGTTSHSGVYTHDVASRLTQVVESATGTPVNEYYTWYHDDSLKTYPGPGYERLLDYDEESRLTSIKQDTGTTQTLKFEYAYGFDGGRRWRKDHANDVWNWYPCGVACCAGELATLKSTLSGSAWSTDYLGLKGQALAFVGSVSMHRSIASATSLGIAMDSTPSDLGRPVFDKFGVARNDSTDLWFLVGLVAVGALLLSGCSSADDEEAASGPKKTGSESNMCQTPLPCMELDILDGAFDLSGCGKMCRSIRLNGRANVPITVWMDECTDCCDEFNLDGNSRTVCYAACEGKQLPPCVCAPNDPLLATPTPSGTQY